MASAIYNIAKSRLLSALLDLDEAGDDCRLLLLMSNTDGDTAIDTDNTSGLTLDECDDPAYARKTCDTQSVATDDANDRAEWDFDDPVWTSLGNGTRQIQGMLAHEHIVNDAGSFPIAWIEFSGTINPGGSTLTVNISAEGAVQLA